MSNRFSPLVLPLPAVTNLCPDWQKSSELTVSRYSLTFPKTKSEIAWVKELCPNTSFYGEAYDQFGLFGGENLPDDHGALRIQF